MIERRNRARRGMTTFEMMIATAILTVVLLAGTGVMSTTIQSWARGTAGADAENETSYVVRFVAYRLQEAYSATVSGDGSTVTYFMPQRDMSGNYIVPIVPEATSRSFYLAGGTLYDHDASGTRVLLTGLPSTDRTIPGTNKSYRVFTAGAGQVVRSVTVHVVTLRGSRGGDDTVWARHRQTIYLRNTPFISQ
jgi:Tfp pilus assembly protein PilE